MKSQSAWDVQSHSRHMKVLDIAPFQSSYVREFWIIKKYKYNSCTQFACKDVGLCPFYNLYVKGHTLFKRSLCSNDLTNHLLYYASFNVKIDTLKLLLFTSTRIMWNCRNTDCYSSHVIPYKTISNYFVNWLHSVYSLMQKLCIYT